MRPNQIKHDITERQARHITGVKKVSKTTKGEMEQTSEINYSAVSRKRVLSTTPKGRMLNNVKSLL